jgi:hypothetical protein
MRTFRARFFMKEKSKASYCFKESNFASKNLLLLLSSLLRRGFKMGHNSSLVASENDREIVILAQQMPGAQLVHAQSAVVIYRSSVRPILNPRRSKRFRDYSQGRGVVRLSKWRDLSTIGRPGSGYSDPAKISQSSSCWLQECTRYSPTSIGGKERTCIKVPITGQSR